MSRSNAAQFLTADAYSSGFLPEIYDGNFRKRGANLLALKGIVVEKGERIDADVEFLARSHGDSAPCRSS